MAIPNGATTGTAQIGALVQTAYDQYVRMALRDIPVMRSIADVKPVQQAMPGSSVVFSIYSDLAQATSTLTETTDVSSIALGNPTQVSVTLNEYGSAVTTTKKLNLTSFNDVDSALADIIAYNAADSIDKIVANTLSTGQNSIVAQPTAPNMSVDLIRQAVVNLRTNKALPRLGELYAAYLHPRQSADLRAEAGTGGFQELTKYVERTPFTAGSIGVLEGAYIVETPRVLFGTNVNGQIVQPTVITGFDAIQGTSGAGATFTSSTSNLPQQGDVVTFSNLTGLNAQFNGTTAVVTQVLAASNAFSIGTGQWETQGAPPFPSGNASWTGSGGAYFAIVAGREALAEAQAADISTVIGPEIDALRRFRTIGWYYFGGFARLREAALYNIQTGSSY
jgi:N4-gp56 family major capsid protein